jgi:hypothetical protein
MTVVYYGTSWTNNFSPISIYISHRNYHGNSAPYSQRWIYTTTHLAKEVTAAGVIPVTATKTEAWWLIWLAKCTEWEINLIQDLSIMHPTNYLAAFTRKVCTGNITSSGECFILQPQWSWWV